MADIFKHIFDYIFIKTKNGWARFYQLLFVILILLFINNYFGITENIRVNQKLSQLEKLKNLDPDSFQADSSVHKEITLIKYSLLNKSNFTEKSRVFISTQFRSMLNWRSFSAGFTFLLAIIFMPFAIFSDKTSRLGWQEVLGLLIMELFVFITCILFIKVLGLIPDLKYAWINHVINILVQVLIITTIIVAENKKSKR